MSTTQLSIHFFLQAAVILLACRVAGRIAIRFGQPQVIGEMIAGVALGPSLFGLLWPAAQQSLFPQQSLDVLYVLAQLGAGLYMFMVGTEFRAEHLRSGYRSALWISGSGIVVPFVLAFVLTPWLVGIPGLFPSHIGTTDAALFLGAAIAITAFPVLARIIHERGLAGTRLGSLVLSAGAIDDAAAWCLLAVVLARIGGHWGAAWLAIVGGLAFVAFMVLAARPLLQRLDRRLDPSAPLDAPTLAILLTCFCLSAWFTDYIGIHAVFGGFVLGACLPKGAVTARLREQVQPFVVVFLLPLFFTYSGLRTRLDVLLDPSLFVAAIAILIASFAGKALACWAAARAAGLSSPDAMAVGALMNARGLMELILINIGLQAGIIGQGMFSILVLMTLVTTLLATPLFNWSMERRSAAVSA